MESQTSSAPGSDSRGIRLFREVVESGRPLTYIKSTEEQRVSELLNEAAQRLFPAPIPVWSWSLTEGMRRSGQAASEGPMADARGAVEFVAQHPGSGIFHLKDFHDPLRDGADVRRRLRDLYQHCFEQGKFIVISSPVQFIPDELSRQVHYFELLLPDLSEILGFLRAQAAAIVASGGAVDDSADTLQQIGQALQGLTLDEARHALRRALATGKPLGLESLPALYEEKRLLVNRAGMIQFVADGAKIDRVGGLEVMKKWLLDRRELFVARDRLSAEIVPKGVLVMGVSGCGKSLSVKAIASCFGLPLYRIDMTEVFSGRYGKPEGAFAEACRMLEQIAPAVVWFDEIEMGITSAESAGEQGRLFAFFLTWMQEKTSGLFVAATANRIDLLPAEMIRKGRFDEVFFVDLPLDDERIEIFRIHLQRRGVDPQQFQLDRLTRLTKGWTGAEVEQCVVSALTAAHLQNRAPNDEDLLSAAGRVVPLSKTMKEQVDHIRQWAYDRAVRASPSEFAR